jgi:Carboxypeptidase regulatory-like domain
MKKYLVAALLLLVLGATAVASGAAFSGSPFSKDKDKNAVGRLLTGKVLDHHENPLPNAIVYLTNTRTGAVKSYIVGADGTYRFPELSPNIDYEVYTQYKGRKSDTKTVSQFDDRTVVNIVLHIDLK